MNAVLRDVGTRLSEACRVLLTTHPSPDGDGLGCMAALCSVLRARGKDVVLYSPEPLPARFLFLHGLGDCVSVLPTAGFDITVLLDCSDGRTFGARPPMRGYLGDVVALDHHKTVGDFADTVVCDPRAASAGVVVYRLLGELGWAVTRDAGIALYCSLVSDTGSFRYQNTNGEALRMGAELVEAGVEPWSVAASLSETRPRCQLELLGRVLQTLDVSESGRIATLTVDTEMIESSGCQRDHADGFINFIRGLEGVEVAALLRAEADGRVRVSMRSRGRVDVSKLALSFGGGGHHNAAGFTAEFRVPEVKRQLFAAVVSQLGESGKVKAAG